MLNIMRCPQSTDSLVAKMGIPHATRGILFYLVCIPIRLYLAFFVYLNHKIVFIPYLVFFFSCFALYSNIKKRGDCVWWFRELHIIVSASLIIASMLTIIHQVSGIILSYLLLMDVILGFLSSLVLNPFFHSI